MPYLGVRRAHTHGLRNLVEVRADRLLPMAAHAYLLINDDINFHTLLSLALKDSIETPFGIIRRRTT